jgi:hypothetical protein
MKNLHSTISVIKDTNRVVAQSDVDFSVIRPNSYFKVENDTNFYIVAKSNKFFFIEDFKVISRGQIQINKNIGIDLLRGDTLKLSYKEYTGDTLIEIKNGGGNYKVGDELSPGGGSLSVDVVTGFGVPTTFKVEEVNERGTITKVSLKEAGKYIVSPHTICEMNGGNGAGAVFEMIFALLSNRALIERTISTIAFEKGVSNVFFDYNLPANITEGKLSVEKYELTLTSPYLGDTKISSSYSVARDFTANLKLPFLVKNSFSTDTIINQAFNILDNKITELEARIKKLEK